MKEIALKKMCLLSKNDKKDCSKNQHQQNLFRLLCHGSAGDGFANSCQFTCHIFPIEARNSRMENQQDSDHGPLF